MQGNRFFSREEAQALARRVLSFSTAEQARVNLQSGMQGNTRFAVNQVSTAGDVYDASVTVTSAFGKRVASATTNRFDDEALRQAVQTSERLARLVPEDPEYLGELDPQQYSEYRGFAQGTVSVTPEDRARAVAAVAGPAAQRSLLATGFISHFAGSQAVANSKGLFAYLQGTGANYTTTVRTPDGTGSGWAGVGHVDWAQIDPAELARRAIQKAEASREPRAVEPGKWTVILEPTAVANLVSLMMFSLNARAADEGRSFFSKQGGGNKIGEKIVDARVTIHSDPADPALSTAPFDFQGLPNRREVWIENGVVKNLVYNRFWAQRNNRQPTGFVSGYSMSGGDATIEQMIESTERGLLVTRLWYIRSVDPRTILFTGLTRDGTFLIENGRITTAVKNLRWNESPIFLLNSIEALGRPVRVSASEDGNFNNTVIVPPVKARDFTFTSLSDAV
ncbi:MAG TPA: TldD/PmbA family protein [Longimicrobiaceae bacterium]|nr:TldD/PmbA family protein [Longimicrobiaceae bacterium]